MFLRQLHRPDGHECPKFPTNFIDHCLFLIRINVFAFGFTKDSEYELIIWRKDKTNERGYNPETPSNFPYHSKLVLITWHTHSSYDWWRLPSGEAALASPLWQAPSNSSLDWASVGVTLGPDSELSVWVLVTQCWGITLGQGSWHLSWRTGPGRVQGEGLCWGWQEAGTRAYKDLGWPRKSPGGKAYVEDDRRLGLRCIDLGWSVSRDAGPR